MTGRSTIKFNGRDAVAGAYYNEIDPYAAEWLRNLIRDGHIAPGDVDTRSIEDVKPDDLRGYTQCHFFAGLGLWSYALRRAGWSDERRIWTGSCPCQPFSSAGKGDGFGDERHLWPAFAHLVAQCGPPVVCGEQVASKDGYAWLDLVQTDMEGLAYAFWPVVLPVAGVGGPGERHRIWWVGLADAPCGDAAEHAGHGAGSGPTPGAGAPNWIAGCGTLDGVAHDHRPGQRIVGATHHHGGGLESGHDLAGRGARVRLAYSQDENRGSKQSTSGAGSGRSRFTGSGIVVGVADAAGERFGETRRAEPTGWQPIVFADSGARTGRAFLGLADLPGGGFGIGGCEIIERDSGYSDSRCTAVTLDDGGRPGPLNGFWGNADWLFCTDGKWRPVEPGTRPLAYGLPLGMGVLGTGLAGLCTVAGINRDSLDRAKKYRVGTLRGYGNAISPEPAIAFIESWRDVAP